MLQHFIKHFIKSASVTFIYIHWQCHQSKMHGRQRCYCQYSYWQTTPCPKINDPPPASNTPNSVCSSWISTRYRTLHYLNIIYGHNHYDARTLLCLLTVTSLWRQSLFTLRYVQCTVTDKGIKQQRTCLRLRACVEAKGGHFEHKL